MQGVRDILEEDSLGHFQVAREVGFNFDECLVNDCGVEIQID